MSSSSLPLSSAFSVSPLFVINAMSKRARAALGYIIVAFCVLEVMAVRAIIRFDFGIRVLNRVVLLFTYTYGGVGVEPIIMSHAKLSADSSKENVPNRELRFAF